MQRLNTPALAQDVAAATVDTGDNTASLDGVISGGRLSKTGDGKLTLSADNTYTGGTNVVNGTLRLMTAQSAGSGQEPKSVV